MSRIIPFPACRRRRPGAVALVALALVLAAATLPAPPVRAQDAVRDWNQTADPLEGEGEDVVLAIAALGRVEDVPWGPHVRSALEATRVIARTDSFAAA